MVYYTYMYKRFLVEKLKLALEDTPVVFLNGARQAGKSTLVKHLQNEEGPEVLYFTFDDLPTLDNAKSDPIAFLNRSAKRIIIDEVQRAPELFLPIKAEIDRQRTPGRFILTGSADIFLLPKIADSLAGRIEILTLHPLSLGELSGIQETFIEDLFSHHSNKLLASKTPQNSTNTTHKKQIIEHIVKGGFPPVQSRESAERRGSWFNSYVMTIIERDIRELANIEGLTRMPNLLKLLAARTATLLNMDEIGRSLQIPASTLKRYFTLLLTFFLVHTLPAWSNNRGKRLIKSPKIHLSDTGVLCNLLGISAEGLLLDPKTLGNILETFVLNELIKMSAWNSPNVSFYHYRTVANKEVDIVLESNDGRIVGIEVKATETPTSDDFKGLRDLKETAGDKFVCGVVLHLGKHKMAFGEDLYALPVFGE